MNSSTQGRPRTHSALLVCYEEREDGEIHFLAMNYTEVKNCNPVTFVKFPVETGIGNETPKDTATSGMYQEVAKNRDFAFRFVSDEPFFSRDFPGDADKGGGVHTKCAFLLTKITGELRDTVLVEEGRLGRSNETLSPPKWYEASELLMLMKERGVKFHCAILVRALAHLAQERNVYNRYRAILEHPLNQQYLAD